MADIKKWYEVYSGDDEKKFFVGSDGQSGLIRKKKDGKSLSWRSVEALAKESGLTQKRVEEIINKYLSSGIVKQNPSNETLWGYHWNVKDDTPKPKSMGQTDKENRVSKATKP